MKKILLILTIFCVTSFAYAQETMNEVFLDLNYSERQEYKKFSPDIKKMNIKKEEDDNEDYIYHPLKYIRGEASELYSNKIYKGKQKDKTILDSGANKINK